ncbi:hypothetical protein SB725_32700, partial [Pseudomonas sp. SIMBA_041]|uniref:hypothetical protein n=1 Tax=Pseudomonas sp. SIMBA_041 TaxID=3085782 RepID=UPI00397E15D1
VESHTSKFDLTLHVEDADDGLAGAIEYNLDLFDASTIERMAAHFCTQREKGALPQGHVGRHPEVQHDGRQHQPAKRP